MPDPLARLRAVCLSLPEAVEQEAWGEPTFRVRKKIFAMYAAAGNHHGQGRRTVWCSAGLGVQEVLVRSDPETYFVPPYVGVKGWIGVDLDRIGDRELREHVVESYCRVAPKKLAKLVDG
ncbi:MAG TPA: MmcQ/YjbR family DNA-binding protein [Longimicrobium sp.]|nr:MmcQ/YjbR family DNA-binding protein [Longimicrobium sp.]